MGNTQTLLNKNGGVYNDKFKERLIQFNNTPREDGFTPASMFNGRTTRSLLPEPDSAYAPIDQEAAAAARDHRADIARRHYDKHARPLPPLEIGQKVVALSRDETWSTHGTVKDLLPANEEEERSYMIELPGGTELRRNRRHLRPDLASQHIPTVTAPADRTTVQQPTQPTAQIPRRSARIQAQKP